ncbi:hypothetical protein ACFL2M_00510 [Patescibacteria group bacterium]
MNTPERLGHIEKDIDAIKQRNVRVAADKAWETSWFRKVCIVLMTYIIAVVVMYMVNIKNPFTNALIPTVGFYLSTISLPFIKKWWVNRYLAKK